jgi:hypothetical protein
MALLMDVTLPCLCLAVPAAAAAALEITCCDKLAQQKMSQYLLTLSVQQLRQHMSFVACNITGAY